MRASCHAVELWSVWPALRCLALPLCCTLCHQGPQSMAYPVHRAVVVSGGLCPGLNDVVRALVMKVGWQGAEPGVQLSRRSVAGISRGGSTRERCRGLS